MARYDIERLLDDVSALMKASLNTKLAAIQAEKDILLGSDNFNVKQVNDKAWFDSLNEVVTNYDPFIYYGITVNEVTGEQGATAEDVQLFIMVLVADNQADKFIIKRMLRYVRALKEIVQENFDKLQCTSKFRVETVAPQDVKNTESGAYHKMSGIVLQTAIG